MGKRKHQKTNSDIKALIIFVGIMVLVWGLTSCGQDIPLPPLKEQPANEVINDISEEQVSNEEEEEKEEIEVITEEPIEEEVDDEIGQGSMEEDNFDYTLDPDTILNETLGWSFKRNSEHTPVIGYNEGIDLEKYGAYYIVETEEKVIYLTFDAGYENGYTAKMLDALLENNAQASFFVTESYIKRNTDLVIRMKEEGHIVANHSVTHPSFPTLTEEELRKELEDTANTMAELTGYDMDPFFRPPSGEYSERILYLIRKYGYRTIFWSLTYLDWNVNEQPGAEYAYDHVMTNYHPGAIPLIHAVSESNAEALDDILKSLKAEGYRFGNLYEVE